MNKCHFLNKQEWTELQRKAKKAKAAWKAAQAEQQALQQSKRQFHPVGSLAPNVMRVQVRMEDASWSIPLRMVKRCRLSRSCKCRACGETIEEGEYYYRHRTNKKGDRTTAKEDHSFCTSPDCTREVTGES